MTDNNNRYFTLLTDKGKFKIAKAAADKGEVKFSHFAIGDGGGQEVNPTPNQTALVHEVWRAQLDSVEIDPKNPAAIIINAIIPHNVGGWWMREFGLFDIDGDMLAVVKPAPYYKATSAEGQLEDVYYEFQLVIGEQAQVVVLVDPSILWATREYVETRRIPAWQLMNTPWLPVKALDITTPPTSNNQGDTYVIPAASKGAWKDKTGQLAEWNGKAWNFIQTRDGHGIGLPDGSIYIKINGVYVPLTDLFDKRYAKFPEPPATTFYVVGPTGNDKNSGLKPTPADGFATIQGAIDKISARYMSTSAITINVAPGVYDGFSITKSMIPSWVIKSAAGNKKSVSVLATDPKKPVRSACRTGFGTQVDLMNMTLAGLDDTVSTTGGTIKIYSCDITLGSGANSQAVVSYGGSINIYGEMNISGSGIVLFRATGRGDISLGFFGGDVKIPLKIIYNNVKATWAALLAEGCSTLSCFGAVVTFDGVPDGMAYTAFENGVISTHGSGTNIFPGTRPGWVGTGGVIS
ncbi:phage tail protein [Bartonella sp. W8125]|uniref:phage tail protein n=1 Tax=Bartonella TaxID=773 RepID=UPI0018DC0426|nr:phage tail protein [Bartonella choladocola]MBI0141193.1 phage tail protein [Bartonella choladocola]